MHRRTGKEDEEDEEREPPQVFGKRGFTHHDAPGCIALHRGGGPR